MRDTSPELAAIIQGGSFGRGLVADVFYGPERVLQDVPVDDWSLNGDITADVKTGGSCTIVYQGDYADSVTPRDFADALAPYGQEIRLYVTIAVGDGISRRIPMGVYRIDDVPSGYDRVMPFQDRIVTLGSVVQLTLLDRFGPVKNAQFRSLEQPPSLVSVWAEIARVSGLPVSRTVADRAIPASVVYTQSRLDAIQQLASVLGGRAFMSYDGTVAVIPDIPGAPVSAFPVGDENVILDTSAALHSDGVCNVVVLDTEDPDGNPIHAEAEILDGPLATTGPYGEVVDVYPDDQKQFITTQEAADTAVQNRLALVSTMPAGELDLSIVPDPRLELGDVVTIERPDRIITGRVNKYTLARTGAQQMTVGVLSAVAK